MDKYINVTGITVRGSDYRDNSKILSIFTKEYGSIDVLARGCKKKGSPLLSVSGNLCLSRLNLTNVKGRFILAQGEVIHSFYNIALDIEKFAVASFISTTAYKTAAPMESHSALFALVINLLYLLESAGLSALDALTAFCVKSADIFGVRPNIHCCVLCRTTENIYGFSIEDGGVICRDCKGQSVVSGMSTEHMQVLDFILKHKNKDLVYMPSSDKLLARLMCNYIMHNFNLHNGQLEFLSKISII